MTVRPSYWDILSKKHGQIVEAIFKIGTLFAVSEVMVKLSITLVLLFGQMTAAQDFHDTQELARYLQSQSSLFTITLVPGDKTIKFFVVGYETVNAKLTDQGPIVSTFSNQRDGNQGQLNQRKIKVKINTKD